MLDRNISSFLSQIEALAVNQHFKVFLVSGVPVGVFFY